jgi:hypothetical protein
MTMSTTTAQDGQMVPGPIAIALMTGRVELVRPGMESVLASAYGTPYEPVARQLVAFAEGVVRDIQAERDMLLRLSNGVQTAQQAVRGIAGGLERLGDAFDAFRRGSNAQEIDDMLKSNTERARERKLDRDV